MHVQADKAPRVIACLFLLASPMCGCRTGGTSGGAPRVTSPSERPPVPRRAESGERMALRWLKRAQDPKTGGWSSEKWGGAPGLDRGVSGLALLAFFNYSCTDKHPSEFAEIVRKAVEFLLSRQRDDGSFGENMYTQAICTMALSEASVMLRDWSLRRTCRAAAQRGVDFIVERQPPHGVFQSDVVVTAWQSMALESARMVFLKVPEEAGRRTERFLALCVAEGPGTPQRIDAEGRHITRPKLSTTAAALAVRRLSDGDRRSKECIAQANWLATGDKDLEIARAARDLHTIDFMTTAAFLAGGKRWRRWNAAFNRPLARRQAREGPDRGSWPVAGTAYGHVGGRVYTTAIACLTFPRSPCPPSIPSGSDP